MPERECKGAKPLRIRGSRKLRKLPVESGAEHQPPTHYNPFVPNVPQIRTFNFQLKLKKNSGTNGLRCLTPNKVLD